MGDVYTPLFSNCTLFFVFIRVNLPFYEKHLSKKGYLGKFALIKTEGSAVGEKGNATLHFYACGLETVMLVYKCSLSV